MVGLERFFLDDGRPVARTTRVGRAVFALAFAATLPLVFADLAYRDAAVRRRPVVPCTILASGVETTAAGGDGHESPYQPWVAFTFELNGRQWMGHGLSADDGLATGGSGRTANAAWAYAQADRYPPGGHATCYVDASDPGRSSLVQPVAAWERWVLPAGLAGVAAVAVLYCVPQVRLAMGPAGRGAPPKTPAQKRRSALVLGLLLFPAAGSVTAAWYIVPVARTIAARRWPAVACVVEQSRVNWHREAGDVPITVYRTDVLYRYVVAGRTYHSNQYSLTEGASPAAGGRRAVAAAHPVGHAGTCWVDPADPTVAVLTRRLSPTVAFGLFPSLLTAAGLFMVVSGGTGRTYPGVARLLRRRWLTLATLAIAALAWGVFGRP